MKKVSVLETNLSLPTYEVGKADKNPLFLEKRVYQASKGNVYPYAMIEKVFDEKVDKIYKAIVLENDYIQITLIPELGGRIQYGYDKINDYDFFYRNNVIKPALVGLTGPWISGGVEFNWPQHHRPSTFDPVEYEIIENSDGSVTVWMSEIEKMSRMVGKVGITVYPDKAYVESKGSSYNYSDMPQNFLWWANIAVHVHDKYETFFPLDVKFVADHGKRDMTSYPFADTIYYNVDYPSLPKEKRNITNYDNIPVPMSYMALGSDFDFFGGYDFSKEVGTMYVSNHHTAPGKKQWTWGNSEFGLAWDRQLTDNDGPYAELMAGAFTDNQPDFTWINPGEVKEFNQYWYPFKKIGKARNANLNAAVYLDYSESKVVYKVTTPSHLVDCELIIYKDTEILLNQTFSLKPEDQVIEGSFDAKLDQQNGLGIKVLSSTGNVLIDFVFKEYATSSAKPAIAALKPNEILSNDELYRIGLHLEQYRHATYYADDYYLEALRRDDSDVRCNTAYGMLLLKRLSYETCDSYFEKAIDAATKYNPNPKDCEAFYGLGLSLFHQGKIEKAYDRFYKAVWDYKYRSIGYLKLAQIDCLRNDYTKALEHVNLSLETNARNTKTLNLKYLILSELGLDIEAKLLADSVLSENPFAYIILRETNVSKFNGMLANLEKTYIEIAFEYGASGFYQKAISLLKKYIETAVSYTPMVLYLIGYYYSKLDNKTEASRFYELGNQNPTDYSFPHRIEEKIVLLNVINETNHPQAHYLFGNLLYDRLQFSEAIEHFTLASNRHYINATLYRNLGIASYNILNDEVKALEYYEKARSQDEMDARILYELDQLYKLVNKGLNERLVLLNMQKELVMTRDDLYLEYVTILNQLGRYEEALDLILVHNFHPFEGGEGKISDQYKFSKVEIAKKHIIDKNYSKAIEHLESCKSFPHNLGEGKIYGTPEADLNYLIAHCYKELDECEAAEEYYRLSMNEKVVASSNLGYKPEKLQMNYYQALSMYELGYKDKAVEVLRKLIGQAKAKSEVKAEIDYFSISVPEFLVFEVNLDNINKAHCYYLISLGYLGLQEIDNAIDSIKKSISYNKNHFEAWALYKKMLNLEMEEK